MAVAEREGRPVKLLVVPSSNVPDAIAQTAVRLQDDRDRSGRVGELRGAEMARLMGEAWERTPGSEQAQCRLVSYRRSGELETFQLGPHAPPLTAEDLELIHTVWLDATATYGLDVHHRDVVRAALEHMVGERTDDDRQHAIDAIGRHLRKTGRTSEPPE